MNLSREQENPKSVGTENITSKIHGVKNDTILKEE